MFNFSIFTFIFNDIKEDSGAATVTDVFRASNLNPLIARDYHLPPPNFLEDIPYVAQVR